MNDTMDTLDTLPQINITEGVRNGKDLSLDSPLLNLILAASLLSRFTTKPTKASPTIMTPPVSFVPAALFNNQEPQWPLESPSPTRHHYKFHASLGAQHMKHHFVQIPWKNLSLIPIQQQKPMNFENGTSYLEKDEILPINQNQTQNDPSLLVPSGFTKELQEFLNSFFKRNLTLQLQDEIPTSIGNPNLDEQKTESDSGSEVMSPLDTETESSILPETATEYLPVHFQTTSFSDSEPAESSVDLQAAEAVQRRTKVPQDYIFRSDEDEDDEEDEDDSFKEQTHSKLTQKNQKLRTTANVRYQEGSRITLRPKAEPGRINSKKPIPKNRKRTTPIALIYDEEEQEEDKLPLKRRTVNGANKNPLRRTTPYEKDYDFEDADNSETSPKRRVSSKRKRPTTTTASYDYYESNENQKGHRNEYYDNVQEQDDGHYADNAEDQEEVTRKSTRRTTRKSIGRQQTNPTTEDTGETETDTVTTMSSTSMMTTTTEASTTSGGYPYYGADNYHNISITYGPPVHHYPGYGPSNGNEHISFTYAPPSAPSAISNPMLDSWYNQYAKASVYKRIQDLLTPNNYYNQYDGNYNDGSL